MLTRPRISCHARASQCRPLNTALCYPTTGPRLQPRNGNCRDVYNAATPFSASCHSVPRTSPASFFHSERARTRRSLLLRVQSRYICVSETPTWRSSRSSLGASSSIIKFKDRKTEEKRSNENRGNTRLYTISNFARTIKNIGKGILS